MIERTTIPELLAHVFARLDGAIPENPNDGTTLFLAWQRALDEISGDDYAALEKIGQISALMRKLDLQIHNSKRLNSHQKDAAKQTLSEFKILFEVGRFANRAYELRSHCNGIKRGALGLIGHGLEAEFGEPRLTQPDASEITEALNEIKELLKESNISLNLRLGLARQVDLMIWWLANPEIASVQDLFESIGAAMMVAQQIKSNDPERDSANPTAEKTIFDRMRMAAIKMAKIIGLISDSVEAIEKVGGDVQHLLENINLS